jgi:rSAM/selenodomain-associated transferase 2/rSAM/selenodomain-associated transferase 1
MKNRLILFTRYPIPGKTKTRLIPALGNQGAADLHREMTEYTLERVKPLSEEGVCIEIRYEGGDSRSMSDWLGEDLSFVPQGDGDLGVRMERAFKDSFREGAGKTVVIGSDCPGLDAENIREAFRLLDSNPVVLGPAVDGGYYLIGIRVESREKLFEAVFYRIPWGSPEVLSCTVNALAAARLDLGLLDEKDDVDDPEDMIHWEKARTGRETKSRTRTGSRSQEPPTISSTAAISVIVPVLNEEERIGVLIDGLKTFDVEIIMADGGSTDGTVSVCRKAGVKVVSSTAGRALQMNAGAEKASGQILLFLHADTMLPNGFQESVRGAIAGGAIAGAFSFGTDLTGFSMGIIEGAANLRARYLGVVFGDQALFTRADSFHNVGGFPLQPIMEDFELARALKGQGRFAFLPLKAVTSARRWRDNGIWRTTLINQTVTWLYMLGMSPEKLVKWYRRKLKL